MINFSLGKGLTYPKSSRKHEVQTVEFLPTQAFITLASIFLEVSEGKREYHWTRLMENVSVAQGFT